MSQLSPVTLDPGRKWPLERILFALAGTMTLLGVVLAVIVSPWFLLLTAFVGLNQWLYVTLGNCPASVVLEREDGTSETVALSRQ